MEKSGTFWSGNDALAGRCTFSVVGTLRKLSPPDSMQNEWTSGDVEAGRCTPAELGNPRTPPTETFQPKQSPDAEQPDQPDSDQPEMSDDMFVREMAAYKQDPLAYKARTAPGVVTKLFEVAERRRLESLERERVAKVKPIEEMNANELSAALMLGVSSRMLTSGPEDFARYLTERMGAIIVLPDLEARQAALVEAVADIVMLLRNG